MPANGASKVPAVLFQPFEIHLTTALSTADLPAFCDFCHQHQWKPLHIVLDRGATTSQPMATIHGEGDEAAALEEMRAAAKTLVDAGWKLARGKIEFDITSLVAPEELPGDAYDRGRYYEHHFKLRLPTGERPSELEQLASDYEAHWSRNALKRFDGYEHRFVTMRHRDGTRARSLRRCEQLEADLIFHGVEIVKRESEYCVYDSKCELDAGWLPTGGVGDV